MSKKYLRKQPASSDALGDVTPVLFLHRIAEPVSPLSGSILVVDYGPPTQLPA